MAQSPYSWLCWRSGCSHGELSLASVLEVREVGLDRVNVGLELGGRIEEGSHSRAGRVLRVLYEVADVGADDEVSNGNFGAASVLASVVSQVLLDKTVESAADSDVLLDKTCLSLFVLAEGDSTESTDNVCPTVNDGVDVAR